MTATRNAPRDVNWLLASLVGEKPSTPYKISTGDAGVIRFMRAKVVLKTRATMLPTDLYRYYLWFSDRMGTPAVGFMAFHRILVRYIGVPRIKDGHTWRFRCNVVLDRLDFEMDNSNDALTKYREMLENAAAEIPDPDGGDIVEPDDA
jgi:hypothetical protein